MGYRNRGHVRRWEFRRNPLKKKILDKKLKKLKELLKSGSAVQQERSLGTGPSGDVTKELKMELSSEFVHPTQAIYILDWWTARASLLSLLALPRELDQKEAKLEAKYILELTNYINKYQIDPYDLELDRELQIDHYGAFRHFIHLAQSNPYFRLRWPRLHRIEYTVPGPGSYYGGRWQRQPVKTEALGEVRQWDSKTTEAHADSRREAIKILRGRHVTDAPSIQDKTRIPKESIISVREANSPSDMLEYLKDAEDNMVARRDFKPKFHEPFLTFDDGKEWAIIHPDDRDAEGVSLADCARPESAFNRSVLLSLREPTPGTDFYQAVLKAEVVFPEQISAYGYPKIADLRSTTGIVNQLRAYGNSKPDSELHPYILPLIGEEWIGHFVKPDYPGNGYFELGDLSSTDRRRLFKKNKPLFDTKLFYDTFKKLSYPKRVQDQLIDKIELPVKEVLAAISAKTYNPMLRKVALRQIEQRLNRGDRYLRSKIFAALEGFLLRTKDKSMITRIFDILKGHGKGYKLLMEFAHKREEWLLEDRNQTFFLDLIRHSMPGSSWNSKKFPQPLLNFFLAMPGADAAGTRGRVLPTDDVLSGLPGDAFNSWFFILKVLFEIRFKSDGASGVRVRKLTEALLATLIAYPEVLTQEVCSWFQEESGGWGQTSHRGFANRPPFGRKLLSLLNTMLYLLSSPWPAHQIQGRSSTPSIAGHQEAALGPRWKERLDLLGFRKKLPLRQRCYLDLAVTIAINIVDDGGHRSGKIDSFIKRLSNLVTRTPKHGGQYGLSKRGAYDELGRLL